MSHKEDIRLFKLNRIKHIEPLDASFDREEYEAIAHESQRHHAVHREMVELILEFHPDILYCTHCFKNGAFNSPNETLEEMFENCIPFELKANTYPDEASAREGLYQTLTKLKGWK